MQLLELINQNLKSFEFDDKFKKDFKRLGLKQMSDITKKLCHDKSRHIQTYYTKGGIVVSGDVRTVIHDYHGKDVEILFMLDPCLKGVCYRQKGGNQNLFMSFETFCDADKASALIEKEFKK